MYQTRATVMKDAPVLADVPMGGSMLFVEVDDLDAVAAALGDTEYVVPRRKTFYGAVEITVREPRRERCDLRPVRDGGRLRTSLSA